MFDAEFTEQVIATGKIEEGRVIRGFFARSGQALRQDWLVEMAKRLARRLPVRMGFAMGLAALIRPRTRRWKKSRDAIADYVDEQSQRQREALGLVALVQKAEDESAAALTREHA